jgi:hypothetical protein
MFQAGLELCSQDFREARINVYLTFGNIDQFFRKRNSEVLATKICQIVNTSISFYLLNKLVSASTEQRMFTCESVGKRSTRG